VALMLVVPILRDLTVMIVELRVVAPFLSHAGSRDEKCHRAERGS
jgi:hypothetical protein